MWCGLAAAMVLMAAPARAATYYAAPVSSPTASVLAYQGGAPWSFTIPASTSPTVVVFSSGSLSNPFYMMTTSTLPVIINGVVSMNCVSGCAAGVGGPTTVTAGSGTFTVGFASGSYNYPFYVISTNTIVTGSSVTVVNSTMSLNGIGLLATAAAQTTGNNSLSSIDGKITAVNTGAVSFNGVAQPVSGSFFQATQPVSPSGTFNIAGSSVGVSPTGTFNVAGTSVGVQNAVGTVLNVAPSGTFNVAGSSLGVANQAGTSLSVVSSYTIVSGVYQSTRSLTLGTTYPLSLDSTGDLLIDINQFTNTTPLSVSVSSGNLTQVGGLPLLPGVDNQYPIPMTSFPITRLQEEQVFLLREISERLQYLMDAAGRGYGRSGITDGKEIR